MLHHSLPDQRSSNGRAPGNSLIDVQQVVKSYQQRIRHLYRAQGRQPAGAGRRVRRRGRQVRQRQIDPDQPDRRHRSADQRRGAASPARPSTPCSQEQLADLARAQRRRRLPVLPAPADPDSRRECHAADGFLQHVPGARAPRRAPWRCSSGWASPSRPTSCPSALSGGQQQRAAIARALANDPAVDRRRRADRQPRLPDEPTPCCSCSPIWRPRARPWSW